MNIYLNSIKGYEDAIISMYMSKRTWTPELNKDIINTCNRVFTKDGLEYEENASKEDIEKVNDWLNKLFKFGKKHFTMLRFIDISCTVEGLHRAGQDDFDSHAKRLDNRIIRSSTRLATFENEKSSYYENKILTTDEVANILDIDIPDKIMINGKTYIKTVNGYIDEQYENNKDVRRGLYMLSIPSNFIFKCNLTEFSHIVKERDKNSNANPEVREMIEEIITKVTESLPMYNREYCYSIIN